MNRPQIVTARWPCVPEPQEIAAWLMRLPGRLKASFSRREVQVGWGIVLFGALLRLAQPGLAPLNAEHVAYLTQAEQVLQTLRAQPSSAPLSITTAPLPWFSYILTLPRLVGRDPRNAVAFFGALNALGVALLFGIGRRFFGWRCAAIAGLLFATAPWAVLLARRVAPEAIVVPLSAAILASLCSAVRGGNPWAWTLAYLLGGLALFVSADAWPLVLSLVVVSALFWRTIRWPYAALGASILLLVTANYLYGLASAQPEGIAWLWRAQGQDGAGAALPAVLLAGGLHAGRGLEALAAPSTAQFALNHSLFALAGQMLLGLWALSLPGTLWLALRSWSRWREGQDSGKHLLVAAWNVTPMLVWIVTQSRPWAPAQMAYLLPGGFLAMAIVADWLLGAARISPWRRYRWGLWAYPALWGAMGVLMLWNVYATAYVSRFVTERDAHLGYGTPYRYWEQTTHAVWRALRALNADQVWIVPGGGAERQAEQSPVLGYLLAPLVESVVIWQQPAAALLPAERPAVYVLAGPAPWAEGLTAYLGGQDAGVVLLPEGQGEVRIRTLAARSVDEMLSLVPVRALRSFDAGLRLVGYEWPSTVHSGDTAVIGTYWTFWDVPWTEMERSHRLTVTLVDGAGREVARAEGLALSSSHWQEGLLLKQWHLLGLAQAPPGDYVVKIALERIGGTQSLYLDESGLPIGNAFVLGPVSVATR
jgi:hypothetical protein